MDACALKEDFALHLFCKQYIQKTPPSTESRYGAYKELL